MDSSKGYEFESEVEKILRHLEGKFPNRVKITAQPDFPGAARPHRADFELEYQIGGLAHRHLIECQHRERSSHEIADKIYAVRGICDRHRYIFIHKDKDYLSKRVQLRFMRMGVLCFDFAAFQGFITQLEADIALHEIGLEAVKDEGLKQKKRLTLRTEKEDRLGMLMKSAVKYNPSRSNPPDQAMTSGR